MLLTRFVLVAWAIIDIMIAIIIYKAFEFISYSLDKFSIFNYLFDKFIYCDYYFLRFVFSYNSYMNFQYRDELKLKNLMPNDGQMKDMSNFFYAFSDDTRLKIIVLLSIKSLCVGDIVNILNQNQTTISHQLKILRSLRIVETIRQGKSILYYIKNQNIENVLSAGVDCL